MIRRLAYLAALIVWLIIMCLPLMAFILAMKGEMKLGDLDQSHLRVFMVQGENEDGVGIEWSRRANNNADCLKSSLRYLLWNGDAEKVNTDYCQCSTYQGEQPAYAGSCQ